MFRKFLSITLMTFALVGLAQAQTAAYPSKPIRMLVPFPPAGGTDIMARLVGNKLTEQLKWNFVIENKPGAGGTIGITEAVKATPSGYEIVMGQKDNLVIGPWLYKNLPWNPTRDLVPVAHVAYTPVLIATSVNSKFKTLKDVVDTARKAPGTINYGSPGYGTSIHLAAEIFAKAAGIEITHVAYKGSSPALLDAISGTVELLVSSVPSAMGQIKGGKLRPLAVTSAKRISLLPDVPAVAEFGYKDFDVTTWYGLLAPVGTPENVVTLFNTEVNKLLANPEMQAAIKAQGAEPLAMTTEQFSKLIKTEYVQWKDIVASSGVKIE